MKLPEDKTKFYSRFKYIELGKYMPKLNKLIRDKTGDLPKFYEVDQINDYTKHNGNIGIYSSVWQWDKPSLSEGLKLGNLYFDLDSPNATDSFQDALRLFEHLRQFIPASSLRFYFTGDKGFHIEGEAVALGIGPSNQLADVFRFIASDLRESLELSTIDFNVYDARRMWRVPYSIHQKTNLFKCELPEDVLNGDLDGIKRYAREPVYIDVPDQRFDFKANEWFREYTYKIDELKQKKYRNPQDVIDRFNKGGTSILRKLDNSPREFDPKELLDGCSAILKWWKYAEENRDLPHEVRLFLLSILSYNDEALEYLHAILSNCSDYSYELSTAHINDWIRRRENGTGGRPFSCEKANNMGVGCGQCDLPPKKKWIEVNGSYIETDEESAPSPIRWAYNRSKNGK